ncbi:acetylxylan esterase [Mesobacillus foraminis]|uniref:acetylxylan esterase n=1 Tax=Mesobacillus foraminis TaxID=279826 RepID=UPI000EF480A8|nr:alpha/beta fold hydrolase [Mesobacillus foraminis]
MIEIERHMGAINLNSLYTYKPEFNINRDFDQFWSSQRLQVEEATIKCDVTLREYPVKEVEVYDLFFQSWDETPIHGLLVKPAGKKEIPLIHHFHGYTGDRGLVADFIKWALLGSAVISFDIRGQGKSSDFARYPNGCRIPGWMTKGILELQNYYYVNVYKDIIAQIQWAETYLPYTRLGAMGASQGGGLALAAAGLYGNFDFLISDWPFLTHIEHALDIACSGPYMEIKQYLKVHDPQYKTFEQVMETLSYVDALHFCPAINIPVLMGIGLEDAVVPPTSAFAAFNALQTQEKSIEVYPQYIHEANPFHEEKRMAFIYKHIEKWR